MKRAFSSIFALLLTLLMLLGTFASCVNKPNTPLVEGTADSETNGGNDTEKPNGSEKDPEIVLTGEHAELITQSNALANGVQAYFPDASRSHYSFKNQEMILNYARSNKHDQLVESIRNHNGAAYIQNTMDVFVRMNTGDVHYASQSGNSAEVNLYRFGYYYYEGLFEFQNFVPKEFELSSQTEIKLKNQYSYAVGIDRGRDGSAISYLINDPADPMIVFEGDFDYSAEDHNGLIIKAKAIGSTSAVELYFKTDNGKYNSNQKFSFPLINDGEYHTYYIPLYSTSNYSGVLKGLRLDPDGEIGSGIAIESMTLGKADIGLVPKDLSINRHFHVYSDKMHHAVQFAVTNRTENIAEFGMLTEIAADTVSKIKIVTDDGTEYDSLDAGFSWDNVVAVGFDVKEAGIFGFILPKDDIAGKIKVELKDGKYVIEQTRTPVVDGVSGVMIPSIDTEKKDKNGNYIHAAGVKNNGNDFYIGQRIYTDTSHDFEEFLHETDLERNPLDARRVSISETNSDSASFLGYDAMRGIYSIRIGVPSGGFSTPYNNPNHHYRANFAIRSDIDRDIYIMTVGNNGILECATLMDENLMLLPVPIEVIKNFSEDTGERNLYNIGDPKFSEAIFYLPLEQNKKQEYTVVNLYQNWGNYPLKQLSQIPFHCPYYHLSTGVTETNCILPWFGTANVIKTFGSTLPDFRSMSAPFWEGQPQHNSAGHHTWLKYTDTEGKTYSVESTVNTITSYGPTYAEVVWDNISDDGKIRVTYTHMEMPQTDENRTYYTMEYEFLEDLTIENFKNNFQFYQAGDNNSTGTYKKIGYLNAENKYAYVDANQDASATPEYVLGNECPYFSFFMMPDWNRESTSAEGYSNVAFLIYNSDFTIGGEKYEPTFMIRNPKDYVAVTLDEEGTIEFKKGDKITINAILLPWGSQELEDDPANRLNQSHATGYTQYTYSTVLEDGTLYMDKNVRDVRENSLLDPLKVTSETDKILDSPFLPRIKSKDGKTATFTLSGGENNVAVRVYGFNMLTAPKVEEYVGGEWVEYVLSSKNNPDVNGHYHYYDGYMVNYDKDGTFSYSFVTTMTGDQTRTFRVTADTEFKGWPTEMLPEGNQDLLAVYTDHDEFYKLAISANHMYGSPEIRGEDDEAPYASIYVKLDNSKNESFSVLYTSESNEKQTGQYLVIKYRIPSTNTEAIGYLEFFASTMTNQPTESGSYRHTPTSDGEWHVDIIDLSKATGLNSYVAADDGQYYAQLLRFDIFNTLYYNADTHVDIAYIGIDYDLSTIAQLEADQNVKFTYYSGGDVLEFDPVTAAPKVETYLDPSSGYAETTEKFGSWLDAVNGLVLNAANGSKYGEIKLISGCSVNKSLVLNVNGWCAIEGGVEKYVYSVDGGKTWIDCRGIYIEAGDAILTSARKHAVDESFRFTDEAATKINGSFQGSGLQIDLSAYENKTVNVILAAVSKLDTKTLALLYCFKDVTCKAPSLFDESSTYTEILLPFGANVDSVNGVGPAKVASSAIGYGRFDNVSPNENGQIVLKGWSIIDGGVQKYVWTADGGKTWNDCGGKIYDGDDLMIDSAQRKINYTFTDTAAAKKNAKFQGEGISIDLSAYAEHEGTLDIFVCAVPANAPDQVVPLFLFAGVTPQAAQ